MDISLEDFIKTNPGKVSRGGRGGRKIGGGRGGGLGAGRGGGRGGLVRKSAGIGAGRGGLRRSGGRASFGRSPRGAAEGMWVHDKFQDAGLQRRAGGFRTAGGGGAAAGGGGSKITVNNLHFGVSDADIIELFGEIGPIRYASVHYDRSGRSMGKADVVFERRGDAQQAINQYNGVPLDGRAMVITFANAATVVAAVSPQRTGLRQVQGGRIGRRGGAGAAAPTGGRGAGRGGRGRGAGGRGAGRGGGGAGGKKPAATPTAAELDAELDAYISANPK